MDAIVAAYPHLARAAEQQYAARFSSPEEA